MKDKIILEGMEFYGFHGVLEEEARRGQTFCVDVELYCNTLRAAASDDLRDTVNYAEAYETVRRIVEEERYNLIETLADRIAVALLQQEKVEKVVVRVKKPFAPIPGKFKSMAVEIVRGGEN
ncbi:dihydroneopterin aldolase [Calderihabitans maritimus]|uniref:7,8-dihydroneopterin aldolase n=1 Tax=Calderihabitans maritimus TaxID=1246530 RepID=A0A1Z5HRS2_9FIRM|nr:dihydroneopterin aldolase [Calderihabitans maritimus]GAW92214.1 dihydroneopterin aldolase [Calderihabitans maritimus]